MLSWDTLPKSAETQTGTAASKGRLERPNGQRVSSQSHKQVKRSTKLSYPYPLVMDVHRQPLTMEIHVDTTAAVSLISHEAKGKLQVLAPVTHLHIRMYIIVLEQMKV